MEESPKKKKSRMDMDSPRRGPEGDSINDKQVMKIKKTKTASQIKTPGNSDGENVSPASSAKKKKKRKSMESLEQIQHTPEKKVKSELEKSTPAQPGSGKKKQFEKKKQKASSGSLNGSWEKAVQKARGLPDGATDDSFFTYSDPNSPTKADTSDSRQEKKKTMKVLQTAAKKIKRMGSGKLPGGDSAQGTKRKRSSSGDDSKSEEMSKKERKKQRRQWKSNYEIAAKAKKLWNELRQQNLKEEDRSRLSAELWGLIKGKAKELIFAHDTSRVIQCLMKYGTQEDKTAVFEELREHMVEMMKSKYAKFFVRKLLKYGTKAQREYVFRKMYGNVRKLIKHQEAAELVELAYNDYAQVRERAALVEEFYGPSFALFKSEEARTLDQIMKSHPEKRDSILRNLKEALTSLVDKSICVHSIVHRVFLEYFTYAPENQKGDMIETVREHVIHMLHTRDGARVAMHCLWCGNAKDRKVLLKTFKTHVTKVAKEEYGHMVLLVAFDVVDDVKFVQKVILAELFKSIEELVLDKYGRKTLLYLLSPRDPLHFVPDIVHVLQQGDTNPHSKKDMAVRRRELLEAASTPLVAHLTAHTKSLVMNNAALLLIMATIKHASCDVSPVVREVCCIAAEPYVAGGLHNFHIVEHPAGHLVLKKLIQNDAARMKDGQDVLFAKELVSTVSASGLKSWAAANRGCFTLVSLLELGHPSVTLPVKNALIGIKDSLAKMDFKGAQILLQKLD